MPLRPDADEAGDDEAREAGQGAPTPQTVLHGQARTSMLLRYPTPASLSLQFSTEVPSLEDSPP